MSDKDTCKSTRYIRADFLEEVVLAEIKRLTKYATAYEEQFAKAVMGFSQKNAALDREALKKSLYAMQARDRELDTLFERIYEDNAAGKLTDERFARMSAKYDAEQKELIDHIKVHQAEKVSGVWEQRLTIHYNCVGAITIPHITKKRVSPSICLRYYKKTRHGTGGGT